eukprot:403335038
MDTFMLDLDSIIRELNSQNNKLDGLNQLAEAFNQGCSTASFLSQLDKLFIGLRSCLGAEQNDLEVVLRANQILIDMLPDIQHSDDLEIQFAQLVPLFIDNLGSPKVIFFLSFLQSIFIQAVLRKSTHKCIATYVKVSKKLEFVLLHIIHTGLDSENSRTRQHSMLVIPALLSLKPQVIDKPASEMVELIKSINKKLRDPQEIVAKTARKLLLEINKCYPIQFENQIINSLRKASEEPKLINNQQQNFQSQQTSAYKSNLNNPGLGLSVVGKEILSSSNNLGSQMGSMQVLDKIISQAKEESKYPMGQNGLFFGFLEEHLIEALNENNQWKERTNSIEAIESRLNMILMNEKKVEFMPYSNHFLGFMIQYIPDINFKISLTSIKIISKLQLGKYFCLGKLLSMNLINFKKYYQQLVSVLIEKLSDSKVNYKPSIFAFHVMRYLQHNNWHVREGAILLLAHCVITQTLIKSNNDINIGGVQQTPEMDIPLPQNPSLIQEICSLMLTEDKQKNQNYVTDLLALIIDKSQQQSKTKQLIQKYFNISPQFSSDDDVLDYCENQKEKILYKSIIERLRKGSLPYINEEQIVEFPIPTTNLLTQKTTPHQKLNNKNVYQEEQTEKTQYLLNQETIASNMTKAPSQNFIEMKRKQQQQQLEEEKKTNLNSSNSYQPTSYYSRFSSVDTKQGLMSSKIDEDSLSGNLTASKETDKIAMWLPSFSNPINGSVENISTSGKIKPLQLGQVKQNSRQSQNQLTLNETSNNLNATQNTGISQQELSSYRNQGLVNQTSSAYGSNIDRLGYTPDYHQRQPRSIQSNEMRLRQNQTDVIMSDSDFIKNQLNSNTIQNDFRIHQAIPFQKNMSQSTGGPTGFGHNDKSNPYVSDRLKLLKSNQKYQETSSISTNSPDKYSVHHFDTQEDEQQLVKHNSDQVKSLNPPILQQRKVGSQPNTSFNGPVRATHEFMQTINTDENSEYNFNATPSMIKSKKPPLTQKQSVASVVSSKSQTRAQSVDNSIQLQLKEQQSSTISNTGDSYAPIEEPLQNPEKQLLQCLEQLKSGDWAKQFEACNTLKRMALFHKQLLAFSNPSQGQILKEMVKIVDSLRSQLSKNALITMKIMIENLPQKDMEPYIDTILPAVLKKAADTNVFISESADACLIALCSCLSENKVFTSLQSQSNVKSNPMKIKLAYCYNALIDKIGARIRQYQNCDKLIQTVVGFLNEGAIEVRNTARIGLLSLRNIFGSQRELENFLQRFVTNEKQLDKIKQMLDKNDLDSVSNVGSTRYGSSMRNSSLETRSAGAFKGGQPQVTATGSDGFGKFTQSSDFNMQQTFLKSSGGSSVGFNSTSNTFKKTNNLVSKPIDPMLMEEFKQIVAELSTNEWNKRLKSIDTLSEFVKNNINTIKSAPPAKFISLIDAFCKVLNDNNAKVLSHAQLTFRTLLLNESLRNVIEQNLSMIVQALNNNLQSTNFSVREQGDILFSLLEGAVDPNLLIPPLTAQINLANNRSKVQLIERLSKIHITANLGKQQNSE